jgi:protein mago nashi
MSESVQNDEFYLRYYVGHRGRFGQEFIEYELYPSGHLRYANNSNYSHTHNSMIRKEVFVSPAVVEEIKRVIQASTIVQMDDSFWKDPDAEGSTSAGRQELECKIGSHHFAFTACEIGSLADIQKSSDPAGLKIFYCLTQDLMSLVLALISINFKARPIPS